jgi:hypothetical protein
MSRHLTNTAHSPRHQRFLDALSDGLWRTNIELCQQAYCTNPGGVASELRANGYHIEKKYERETEHGGRVYKYRWTRTMPIHWMERASA